MAAVTVSPSRVWSAIHATSSAVPIRQLRPSLSTSTGAIASGGRLVDDDGAIPGTAVQPSRHLTRPVSSTRLTGAIRSPCAVPQTALAMCRSAVRLRPPHGLRRVTQMRRLLHRQRCCDTRLVSEREELRGYCVHLVDDV